MTPSIGFFTRLLDDVPQPERYAIALRQIAAAESLGYRSAWIAQHHFDAAEGGLPSPFVLLGAASQLTSRIRLGTAVVTLAHENAVRVAEDAAVVEALSGGRLELGVGTGASPRALEAFGEDPARRREIFAAKYARLRELLDAASEDVELSPAVPGLGDRIWQATFSERGARDIGAAGDGLLLSRHQPTEDNVPRPVHVIQEPVVETYLAALPSGATPRILASRSVFVFDESEREVAERAARAHIAPFLAKATGIDTSTASLDDLLTWSSTAFGTPEQVVEVLAKDTIAARATEVSIQAHSVDPAPELVDRSIELFAREVAPSLGWDVEPNTGEGA